MLEQRLEQEVLVAGQVERLAAEQDTRLVRAQFEACSSGRCSLRRQSPQHDPDARHQLARGKRLGDVVIGADFQADDAVDLVAARGQENHRHVRELAQLAAYFEAVHVGQADVEHNQ
jgi:hypothetical protein